MIDIEILGDQVKNLIPNLPEHVGRARLVATFVSLRRACDLGYKNDVFRQMRKGERDKYLQILAAESPFSHEGPKDNTPEGNWVAGYYFNNALLRIAALAEIGLKYLYEQYTSRKAPQRDYWRLAKWYESEFSTKITHLNRTRQEINDFKHEHANRRQRKLETIGEGLAALGELNKLMDRVASNNRLKLTAAQRKT